MRMNSLKTNAAAAAEGRWVGDLPGLGNIEVKVRGTNTPEYRRRQQAMYRALPPTKRQKGVVDPLEQDRIVGVCLLDHVLLDWKNVEDEEGNTIPFSKGAAEPFLTDPAYAAFRDGVLIAASSVDDEEAAADEDIEGNSSRPSATT
ncbi:MAG: hypothetical protein J0H08_08765 [Rhizobiales bacterium]|nr:hypothetical protein [Hyphomicrobiales bacterium]